VINLLRRLFGRSRPQVPELTWQRVEARLPFLDYLEASERARLRLLASGFLAEKEFHGAHDLALDDDMMLTIALQAALPVFRLGLGAYRGWVGIVVYPGDILIPRREVDEDGVVHEFDDEVLGEAWEHGPVLLSWNEDEGRPDGVNVVIHEFAHKLDMANGGADGLPPLPAGMSRERWARAFGAAYDSLCRSVDMGLPTVLDPYASEHPAEFFAVAAEAFFETPRELRAAWPQVHALLAEFFDLDPAANLDRRV
jgi:Mlc titration factor MtfA (ptsG expression regulator)